MNIGKIVAIAGPVVDVEFEEGKLPHIREALTVRINGERRVMEVAQQVGDNTVRCIMLAATDRLPLLHAESRIGAADAAIFEYIESFYNRTRYHSANGGVSPNARERAYHAAQPAGKGNNKQDPGMETAKTAAFA